MLGILIGVAAVVTVTALGSGARENVSKQIESIGSNFIIVFPQNAQASGARGAQGSGARLTEEDGRAILRESTSIAIDRASPFEHAGASRFRRPELEHERDRYDARVPAGSKLGRRARRVRRGTPTTRRRSPRSSSSEPPSRRTSSAAKIRSDATFAWADILTAF